MKNAASKTLLKVSSLLLTVIIAAGYFISGGIDVSADVGQPELPVPALSDIHCASYCVYDKTTDMIVISQNMDDKIYPASQTKIMTCMLSLDYLDTDAKLTVSESAMASIGSDSSVMGIGVGEKVKVSELLYGLMLPSGNDAANVLAEGCVDAFFNLYPEGGTQVNKDGVTAQYLLDTLGDTKENILAGRKIEAFAALMNLRAQTLGLSGTHFVNACGLHDENHYTTARDMICLARYAWQNPQFRRIVGVQKQNIYWQYPRGKTIEAESTNELLGVYKGMNGIKTGYTRAAGGCLAGAAERDGVQLISVVMGTEGYDLRFPETAALLDYGFARVKRARLLERQQAVRTIHVHNGRDYKMQARPAADVWVPLVDGEDIGHYSVSYDVPRYTTAPVQAGDSVGSLIVSYDGREVERVPLIADSAVSRGFSLMSFLTGIYDGVYSVVFA